MRTSSRASPGEPDEAPSTEQVLLAERRTIAAWLDGLEKEVAHGQGRYERVLQLRRLLRKLDSRIRLVRDLESGRGPIPHQGRQRAWKST